MQVDYGSWADERIRILRSWRKIALKLAGAIRSIYGDAEVYVFGSVVEGRISGASDLDVIVVIDKPSLEDYIRIHEVIEETLNTAESRVIDLHVVDKRYKDSPPYKWWIKKAVKIDV